MRIIPRKITSSHCITRSRRSLFRVSNLGDFSTAGCTEYTAVRHLVPLSEYTYFIPYSIFRPPYSVLFDAPRLTAFCLAIYCAIKLPAPLKVYLLLKKAAPQSPVCQERYLIVKSFPILLRPASPSPSTFASAAATNLESVQQRPSRPLMGEVRRSTKEEDTRDWRSFDCSG